MTKSIPDQFMFGPAFLVNPVTERMYSLTDSKTVRKVRKVYLPKSANWYDFWTGKQVKGGQIVDASAPIETIPLYIKAGSIIPMGPYMQYATEKNADTIEIRIYTGTDAEFVLYEDENDNYNYEKGLYTTINLSWKEDEKTFTLGERKGVFDGMLKDRTFRIVWVDVKNGTGVEPAKKSRNIYYSGNELIIKK
jgi:alpha-D-xyloside xylohydrolase